MNEESNDDLAFELKRLRQKYVILEGSYNILVEENKIATSSSSTEVEQYKRECLALSFKLEKKSNMVAFLYNKLGFVLRASQIQKRSLVDLKAHTVKCLTSVSEEFQKSSAKLLQLVTIMSKQQISERQSFANKFEMMKAEINNLSDSATCKDEFNVQLELELSSSRGQQSDLLVEVDGLKKSNSALQSEIKEQREKTLNLDKEKKQLQISLSAMNEKVKEGLKLREEQANFEIEIKRLQDSLMDESLRAQKFQQAADASQQELKTLHDANKTSAQELEQFKLDSSGIVNKLMNQIERMQTMNDALQGDLEQAQRREKQLRKEINDNSGEKGAMHSRLRSIQDKVKEIEESHVREIREMQGALEASQRDRDAASRQLSEAAIINKELDFRVADLQQSLAKRDKEKEDLSQLLSTCEARGKASMEQVTGVQRRVTELEESIEALRRDRDEAKRDADTARTKLSTAERLLQGVMETRDALQTRLAQQQQQQQGGMDPAQAAALAKSLQAASVDLQQRDAEISGLKDTIRRECEERTEMMILMSELKDELAQYQCGKKRLTNPATKPLLNPQQQQQQQQQSGKGVGVSSGPEPSNVKSSEPFLRAIVKELESEQRGGDRVDGEGRGGANESKGVVGSADDSVSAWAQYMTKKQIKQQAVNRSAKRRGGGGGGGGEGGSGGPLFPSIGARPSR